MADTASQLDNLEAELTTLWVTICAIMVFQMQSGFALLEAGTVRVKNTKNILLKNAIDACVATICWWSVGDAFAYGKCGQNAFIGAFNFFSSEADANGGTHWALWLFNWAFAATSATIVSGAIAERLQFKAYLIYTSVISGFIYPVVVHWVWSNSGWLAARRMPCDAAEYEPLISGTMGLLDFAGSGVVHMVGGGAALMATIIVGPRLGRFGADGKPTEFVPSNPVFQALGVFILWASFYAFNAGSTQCFQGCMFVAANIAVNTTISASFGALTCLAVAILLGLPGDIGPVLNGVLAGLVSITAPCAMVTTYGAAVIGIVGGLVYSASSRLLVRLKVDDPVDAAPVHFFCGAWGVLSVGFFATETSTAAAYTYAADWGVFYGGSGKQLGMQLLGVVVLSAWTCTLSGLLFLFLRKMCWLRVPEQVERQGLDLAQGLSTGLMGKCFKRSAYTMAVEHSLTRPSAMPKPETHKLDNSV
ncbi:hypothetical protein D9Q98_010558 [Chlorella vulgaris]|uniref:Ammonium transporter n=1 Tax=Chlorella vulgaris TaxID=3077 RepID=A0A9D4YXX4_CHLVU|nr:hypothetical protein D9Q98_010558 [Chlorella vulgaris]